MDRNEDGRASLIRLHNHGWKLNLGSALALLCGTAVVFVVYALPALQKPPEQTPAGGNINIQLPPSSPEPQPAPAPKPY